MKPLHFWTPTIRSRALEEILRVPVFLKMEGSQPTASFKIRGIGNACQKAVESGATHLISSSGGNAGYAVAYAGAQLKVKTTIFVPSRTSESTRKKMEAEGALVHVAGEVWDQSHEAAVELASRGAASYIHPFDHPDIWTGHSSMIEEVKENYPDAPGAVVVAVGGGGLMCGVLEGMHKVGWKDVPLVAVETKGAASFAAAVQANSPVKLKSIDTIALTLGARQVAKKALEWAKNHVITSELVSDRAALNACLGFASDHRVLVEPACGAALSTVYDRSENLKNKKSILVIVCGGAGVSLEQLSEWNKTVPV